MALTMWGQVIIQSATPQEDPVQVGTIWIDTSGTPTVKICTAVAPYTFATISGGAPAAHATSHENGGTDEISVAGLSGLLADAQTPLSHVHSGADITSGTLPDARLSAAVALRADKLSVFAATTSAELAGVLSDETGSGGGFVRATQPTIDSPSIDDINLTGGQIAFPASQNASTDANTLDDYEEGTWTPTYQGTSGTGITYSTQAARYVKIGKKVYISGRMTVTGVGTAAGNASLSGFPFTSENVFAFVGTVHIGYWANLAGNFVYLSALVTNNATKADFYGAAAAGAGLGQQTIASLGSIDIIFGGEYLASA